MSKVVPGAGAQPVEEEFKLMVDWILTSGYYVPKRRGVGEVWPCNDQQEDEEEEAW